MNDYISYFVDKSIVYISRITKSGSGRLKESRVTDYSSPVLLYCKNMQYNTAVHILHTNINKVTLVYITTRSYFKTNTTPWSNAKKYM